MKKHKSTDSWKASNDKWIGSEKRKANEKRYHQKPEYKAKAVVNTLRHMDKSESARLAKKRRDSIYIKKTQGKLKSWWKEESKNGCKKCRSMEMLTVDHIISISKGGGDEVENLQCLCFSCNSIKGNK